MVPRTYNIIVVTVTLVAMLLVSLVNIVVDPGSIYLREYLTRSEFDLYASTLLTSGHGMVADGWSERGVKVALARTAGRFDCAVLGSSHVMNVSSHTRPNMVADYCKTVVNLGVSGGGLEDLVIFIYVMASEHQLPRTLFIGIDPWTLYFNSDIRWKEHEDVYTKALAAFESDDASLRESYWSQLAANLVNLHYFQESIELIRETGARGIVREHLARIRNDEKVAAERLRPLVVEAFDYSRGLETKITLPDGSHVPSRAYFAEQQPMFDKRYKIPPYDKPVSPDAVRLLSTMARYLKEVGVEVYFMQTPYHPNVWDASTGATLFVMRAVSDAVRQVSREEGIPTIGSFHPREVGCGADEFYDYMHPTPSCLGKLFQKRTVRR